MIAQTQLTDTLWRAWLYVTQTRSLAMIFGIGFAVLAVALWIASRTRWGQAKPLTKAIVLSVLAHVWLLMYFFGNRSVMPQGDPAGRHQQLSVAFEHDPLSEPPALQAEIPPAETGSLESLAASQEAPAPQPWEQSLAWSELPRPEVLRQVLERPALAPPELLTVAEPTPLLTIPRLSELADVTRLDETPPPSSNELDALFGNAATRPVDDVPIMPPAVAAGDGLQSVEPSTGEPLTSQLTATTPPDPMASYQQLPTPSMPPQMQNHTETLPSEYQWRQAPNRLQLAAAYGADADSEAAVEAGLRWLVAAQSSDGAWNARDHGAGTETFALGESRHGTGDKADTGVSALALLALLSAGHTHLEGIYRDAVGRGLQYLLRVQMPSGDLSGPKQVGQDRGVLNARMYCHSIATLALAEAYAMTGDRVLREALLSAAQYSINAQDPRGGGWRYRPLDAGDLSQFGWQAMALKSAERAGVSIPPEVQLRMRRFLESCAAGPAGGLATYQPQNGRPSDTMTAEALACRLMLGYPLSEAAEREALSMIMQGRPGAGEDNVYFWYYATLALYQMQGEVWREWNQSLKQRLLQTQVPAYGSEPGSWDPDKLWGGYGGRVYSTAMSCLCLEVYYRYLPMYRINVAGRPSSLR